MSTDELNNANDGQPRVGEAGANLTVVLERTVITQDEFNALIIAANPDEFLQCTFGSHVCLLPVEENMWAFKFLADLRSNDEANRAPL